MNKGNNKKVSRYAANAFFWIIIVAIFGGVWLSQGFFSNGLKEVAISDIISRANKGEISKLEIQGNDVKITKKGEKKATEKSVKESGTIYEQGLEKGKTTVEVMPVDNSSEVCNQLSHFSLKSLEVALGRKCCVSGSGISFRLLQCSLQRCELCLQGLDFGGISINVIIVVLTRHKHTHGCAEERTHKQCA